MKCQWKEGREGEKRLFRLACGQNSTPLPLPTSVGAGQVRDTGGHLCHFLQQVLLSRDERLVLRV